MTTALDAEPECISDVVKQFTSWANENDIFIHPSLKFVQSFSGHDVYAVSEIPPETKVLSCPFNMAITAPQSKAALVELFRESNTSPLDTLNRWSERQIVCVYMILHHIWEGAKKSSLPPVCQHKPYIDMLPPSSVLSTTMYFTEGELELLKGSNLYQATLQRRHDWHAEWQTCVQGLSALDKDLGSALTWDLYLEAATHLSSRAFPSTLLSDSPSNTSSDVSHAVLLPGIDSLNHRRATPVSWIANVAKSSDASASDKSLGTLELVLHEPVLAGSECFNNYGPKPNSELILGYGFALPQNPDDTILLSLAASNTRETNMVEIGRDAKNATLLWELVLAKVAEMGAADDADGGEDEASQGHSSTWELELEAAEIIMDMTEQRMERLPDVTNASVANMRQPVLQMIECYLEGQRAILLDLVRWAQAKRIEAKDKARAEGVELVLDDDVEEEE